jgi:WD40 repeat protein
MNARRLRLLGFCLAAAIAGCGPLLSRPLPSDPPPDELTREATSVWGLAYSADGSLLISSHVFQCPSSARCSHLPGPTRFDLWGSGPFAVGKPEGHLATFHSPDWRFLPTGHRFSADGRFVFATASCGLLQWDVMGQQLEVKFRGEQVVLSPDCRTVLRVAGTFESDMTDDGDEQAVEVWDLGEERRIDVLGTTRTFGAPIEIFPDGQRVLAWFGEPAQPQLVIWDLRTKTKTVLQIDDVSSLAVCISQNGQRLAVQTAAQEKHRVRVIDTTTGREVASVASWDTARRVALSPDGESLAIAGESSADGENQGKIALYRVEDGALRKTIIDRETWGFTALCFSPDGKTLVSGGFDGAIKRWPVSLLD